MQHPPASTVHERPFTLEAVANDLTRIEEVIAYLNRWKEEMEQQAALHATHRASDHRREATYQEDHREGSFTDVDSGQCRARENKGKAKMDDREARKEEYARHEFDRWEDARREDARREVGRQDADRSEAARYEEREQAARHSAMPKHSIYTRLGEQAGKRKEAEQRAGSAANRPIVEEVMESQSPPQWESILNRLGRSAARRAHGHARDRPHAYSDGLPPIERSHSHVVE
ncbi:hypothetical protein ACS0TY_007659 [Phlomoides rotata]